MNYNIKLAKEKVTRVQEAIKCLHTHAHTQGFSSPHIEEWSYILYNEAVSHMGRGDYTHMVGDPRRGTPVLDILGVIFVYSDQQGKWQNTKRAPNPKQTFARLEYA